MNKFLYWQYYLFSKEILLSFYNIGLYRDNLMFLHVKDGFSLGKMNDPDILDLADFIYPTSLQEEQELIGQMGTNGQKQYFQILHSYGFDNNYKIYTLAITKISISLLIKFLEKTLGHSIPQKFYSIERTKGEHIYVGF